MAFAIGVIISYLLVFLFAGSNASVIGNDETLTACYIEELSTQKELRTPWDLQHCDHIIVDRKSIKLSTNDTNIFLENLRKSNPNVKTLVKFNIWESYRVSDIQNFLNRTKFFDGISVYFDSEPSEFNDELKAQLPLLFDIYRKQGKLVTMFLYDCGLGNIDKVYYQPEFDYMYVICASDNSRERYRDQDDITVRTVRQLINSGISRGQIVIAINFCPIKAIPSNEMPSAQFTVISIEVGKHDEVCKLFIANHSEENITSNEIINMYEWGNDKVKSQILFNSPETVANRVTQAKTLGLAGVMAYKLECDNTEPICLNKDGRYQLFNAVRKTKEKYDYYYQSDENESVARF